MYIARSVLAAASSLVWPTAVLLIPVGITFSAARVYAEAGQAPPPACTDTKVAACADAGAMQACDCGKGLDCACTQKQCLTAASGVSEALVCEQVASSCTLYAVAPCEGKAEGSACAQSETGGAPVASGTCRVLSSGCLAKNDAGSYESTFPLACVADLNGSDASTTTPSTTSGDVGGGSGCSMLPGVISDSTLLAMPLGLGLAFALRRKRRR